MRTGAPASKTRFRLKLAPFDAVWAVLAPFIALALRDPGLLNAEGLFDDIPATYQYAFGTILCALPIFLMFRLNDGMSRFFSVRDVFAVCGAVVATVATSSMILFIFTRLDGVPRSTPLIYAMVLGGGMIVARTLVRIVGTEQSDTEEVQAPHVRRIILIGVDRFAAVAIKLLDSQQPRTAQIVAALDVRREFTGRTVNGVKIVGAAEDLDPIIDEYAVHGVDVDEVWLSENAVSLSDFVVADLSQRCQKRGIVFSRLSEAFNLVPRISTSLMHAPQAALQDALPLGRYFKVKRVIDAVCAAGLLLVLMPLTLVVAAVVLFDVGAPVLFWQQRIGRSGQKFLLYKFRTYLAPFDSEGTPIADEDRISEIGTAIRAVRFDEIPQLISVLVGDMSLIGPRPLLPQDQPEDPRMRLLARPGITGWAQVNGGNLVTVDEKDALDAWYIRHASFTLDMQIVLRTLMIVIKGERRDTGALEQAIQWRQSSTVEAPGDVHVEKGVGLIH